MCYLYDENLQIRCLEKKANSGDGQSVVYNLMPYSTAINYFNAAEVASAPIEAVNFKSVES